MDTSKSASVCRFQTRRTALRRRQRRPGSRQEQLRPPGDPAAGRWSMQRASSSSRAARRGHQGGRRPRSGPPEGVDHPGHRQPPGPSGRADERASGHGWHSGGCRTVPITPGAATHSRRSRCRPSPISEGLPVIENATISPASGAHMLMSQVVVPDDRLSHGNPGTQSAGFVSAPRCLDRPPRPSSHTPDIGPGDTRDER